MTCNGIAGGNDYWYYSESPYTGMLPYNSNQGPASTEASDDSTMTEKCLGAAKENAVALKDSLFTLANTPIETFEEWKNDPLKAGLKMSVGLGNPFLLNTLANSAELLWTYHGSYLWNNPLFAAFG